MQRNRRKISGQILQGRKNCQMKFDEIPRKKTIGESRKMQIKNCGKRVVEELMRKTMEQIVLEGQVAKCRSLEELYVLWELMQQMEEDPLGTPAIRSWIREIFISTGLRIRNIMTGRFTY